MKETREGRVELKGADFSTISLIVDGLYGELKLDVDNVQDVLLACCTYDLKPLIEKCTRFITDHLTSDNCIDTFLLGRQYGISSIKKWEAAVKHLDDACLPEQLINLQALTADDWIDIVSQSSDLSSNFFGILLEWAKANPNNTASLLPIVEHVTHIECNILHLQDEELHFLLDANAFRYVAQNSRGLHGENTISWEDRYADEYDDFEYHVPYDYDTYYDSDEAWIMNILNGL